MNTVLPQANAKQLSMVILEDDLALIDTYELVFSGKPFSFKICETSDQFYMYLQTLKVRPDILVMDIMMDSMSNNGLSMLEKVSQLYGRDMPPVILSSALPLFMYCNQTIVKKTCAEILPKPFDLPDFYRVVNRLTHSTLQDL